MTRRRRLRRRLLWAGVLLGLVLLLTTVSALRAGLWARDRLVAVAARIPLASPIRKETTMYLKTSLVVLASLGALLLAAPVSADPWGADKAAASAQSELTAMLDARERALVETSAGTRPGWFERFAAAHSYREPVVDDRFRIDPTSTSTPVAVTSSGREIEWPQIGVGLALGVLLSLGLAIAARTTGRRPLAR